MSALTLIPPSSFFACNDDNNEPLIWPEARNGHATVFKTAEQEMLIFGGTVKDSEDNSLWSYKKNWWTKLSSTGPGKREDALLIHNTQNQKCYLIGGRNLSTNTNYRDFWEWSGSAWIQLNNDNPFGHLIHACATYDEKNNRILVFGGSNGSELSSELWIWNGINWTKSLSSGPSARLASSMLYSPVHQKVFLFGGALSNGTIFKEVWELDDDTWTKINETHPSLLTNAYGVAPYGSNFILFGGFKENRQQGAETWIYNPHENTWTSSLIAPPAPRALHSMVYDQQNERVLMFGGGSSGDLLNELWIYTNGVWSSVKS